MKELREILLVLVNKKQASKQASKKNKKQNKNKTKKKRYNLIIKSFLSNNTSNRFKSIMNPTLRKHL